MNKHPSKNAYVTIHFGSNPVYLELELYFFHMLRTYTNNDIIYMYSSADTPKSFVDAASNIVTRAIPFDDRGITYQVDFASGYSNFNTLRTCDFIFAYTLTEYKKICIIESDMVLMRSIDKIFNLKAPAVLTYTLRPNRYNRHDRIENNPREVLRLCKEPGRLNGGIMLIEPSMELFETYKRKISFVVRNVCKYPNESLFEYVNTVYYNLPIEYNLSHYHTLRLDDYGMRPDDVSVFHFNETQYKHLDIIKNPIDDFGDNWMDIIRTNKKYRVKKIPILHYMEHVYVPYRRVVEPIIHEITGQQAYLLEAEKPAKVHVEKPAKKTLKKKQSPKAASPKAASPKASPKASSPKASSPKAASPKASSPKAASPKATNTKSARCPKGTKRYAPVGPDCYTQAQIEEWQRSKKK